MRDRLPFSHLLPLIDLVFVPITMTALHLYSVSKGADPVHIRTGEFETIVPRNRIVPFAIQIATMTRARTMMAVNVPGVLIQWIISLPTTRTAWWCPQALLLTTWQALVFPFFALPFWWLVGSGLDAFVYQERLQWSFFLVGTVLFTLCFAGVIAYCMPMSTSDRAELVLPMQGLIGWTIGFATLPAAWIMQSIRQRRAAHKEGAPS